MIAVLRRVLGRPDCGHRTSSGGFFFCLINGADINR
jgi:hypothetical protein